MLICFAIADLSNGAFSIVIIPLVISFHRPLGFSTDPLAFSQFSETIYNPWLFTEYE